MRIRRHNALCDIIYYALLEDSADACREQGVFGESASRPGDVFHPDFHNGRPTYFDISVKSALHSGVITHSASSPGFAALKGEMEKDARYRDLVEDAGGVFFPLVVDNFEFGHPRVLKCSAPLLDPPQSVMAFLLVIFLVRPFIILWSS